MIVLGLDVEWGKLGEAVYTSAIVGLAVLLIAALAVASSLRSQDARAAGGGTVVAFGAVTAVCVIALAAIVVLGIYLIAS